MRFGCVIIVINITFAKRLLTSVVKVGIKKSGVKNG